MHVSIGTSPEFACATTKAKKKKPTPTHTHCTTHVRIGTSSFGGGNPFGAAAGVGGVADGGGAFATPSLAPQFGAGVSTFGPSSNAFVPSGGTASSVSKSGCLV